MRALTAPADLSDESVFENQELAVADDPLRHRLRRPMLLGTLVVVVFVVIAGALASIVKIEGAISAPGVVKVEFNRSTIRPRDGGIVTGLYVHEGQKVKQGQVLLQFAPTQSQAAMDVMQNQVDSAQAEAARFEAELGRKPKIDFPADMAERAKTDPAVGSLMHNQEVIFTSRRALYADQRSVYAQQIEQTKARIGGLDMQIKANETSASLIRDQLKSYEELYSKGFASRTQVLNLQRTLSDMGGQRGATISQVTAAQESIGEITVNITKLDQQMQTESAQGLRDAQVKLADALPRLRAAQESFENATVRSPVDGYVIGLSQVTKGSAAGSTERLMDIVPINQPLIVEAHVKPSDIDNAKVGQQARVNLTAYNRRTHSGVDADVVNVSADMLTTERGEGYFKVDVRIRPEELARSDNHDVHLKPGMPATVMLLTQKRSLLSFLIGPFFAPLENAFRED